MKNVCFIHCQSNLTWKVKLLKMILDELLKNEFSNLFDFIHINVIGPPIQFKHPKCHVYHFSENEKMEENVTLRMLHYYSCLQDSCILYLHNNGFYPQISSDTNPSESNIQMTKLLLYCLVSNHSRCLRLLNNYDVIGCNYENMKYLYNNWWAKSVHIRNCSVRSLDKKHPNHFIFTIKPRAYNIVTIPRPGDVELYKSTIDSRLKTDVLYCKFGAKNIGLTNQLYSLVNSMILGSQYDNSVVVVSTFMTDLNKNTYCDPQDVIDFPKMNKFLSSYNVLLVPYNEVEFKLLSAKYGIHNKGVIEVTEKCMELFVDKNRFHIPSKANVNEVFGDPFPGESKMLYVVYSINDKVFFEQYDESTVLYNHGCNIDFNDYTHAIWKCMNSIKDIPRQRSKFDHFLSKIVFCRKYHDIVDEVFKHRKSIKYNMIHLRNERDAIDFWGQINFMNPIDFQTTLEKKYIGLIENFFDKKIPLFILSMNINNSVLDYLHVHGYDWFMMEKPFMHKRELNALCDYIASLRCNNVFIGNINPHTLKGSTFSYLVCNGLPDTVQKYGIDLDHIHEEYYKM